MDVTASDLWLLQTGMALMPDVETVRDLIARLDEEAKKVPWSNIADDNGSLTLVNKQKKEIDK